jgi:hypothetical protein
MPKVWSPARTQDDLPELAGWMTLEEAAAELGVSRTTAHKYVYGNPQRLATAHKLGKKPFIVVRSAEVEGLKAAQQPEVSEIMAEA